MVVEAVVVMIGGADGATAAIVAIGGCAIEGGVVVGGGVVRGGGARRGGC